MYLKLMFRSESILELEQLPINCKYLNGIYFHILYSSGLDKLFEMLTTSSPTNLSRFKFNFNSYEAAKLEFLKLFLIIGKVEILCYYKLVNIRVLV
jgi:hypothetical protein